jgi:putative DNA primase/helicase
MPDFVKVPKEMVFDAMMKVARENTFDSAIDYLQGVKWDGTPRLDQWLTHTYGTPDDLYHQKVGSNWMKGLVRRIMVPGCKFDHVLVLEGEQGTRKSTSLMVLGGDWHVETAMSTDNKDFFMMFQGKAIIEFSEGETLSRTETKRMKAIITTQVDKYRPAYGRMSVDFKRRCVFAMTTNADEYLKDETGNRRWLPVKCYGTANIDWLRDQLFAEAYHRVMVLNETTWEFPDELMKEAQDLRRLHDPWEDLIAEWYFELTQRERDLGITVHDAYIKAVHKGSNSIKPMARFEEMNISEVFRRVLRLDKRRTFLKGVRAYRYYQAGAPELTEEDKKEIEDSKKDFKDFEIDEYDNVQIPANF